ncbi:TetR/AcrR family transcriptional regulator [Amycolatopsis azurea]|uniref:TetR family transcriptional regulator n=1 Tax=Amycolatopsis azurea DSM 43854 TaxID=1238180 RepID=M2PJY1_9PSEU|nr:TetR/AcrR family transcriptional regulator [Amycolatopsis azurea]EMD24793.1 Transcriptional regulator, TetR family [Amycolatopsis azurea DSM 43854]OOC08279.1 TetR family transcriptional regulator [Amycolatopsis azurea DSM 43854]
MPKRVDHQERRRGIAEALFRIAAAQGLQAVTLRAVASEAGISMNLVQYYFSTKEEMLRFAWRRMVELTMESAGKTVGDAMATEDERTIVRAYLTAVLPEGERDRMLAAVQIAYFAVDVTRGSQDPDQEPLLPHLVNAVTDLLRKAQEKGDIPARLDPRLEADSLATMSAGLVTAIMVDAYTAERAAEIVDYRLDGVFTGGR